MTGDDRGSVLLLGVGMVVVCLLAATLVVNATSAFLQRQRLVAVADGAALAGAQAIDLGSYYATGATAATRLDPAAASAAARRHLVAVRIPDARLVGVRSDGTDVVVELSAPLRLPFLGVLLDGEIRVESRARLAYRGGSPAGEAP